MSVLWLNSDRLIREIEQAPEAIGEAIADELEKAGDEIKDKAKAKAPVLTGELKESIKCRTTRKGAKSSVRIFADYPKTEKFRKSKTRKQAAGSRAYYAFAVEYGTKRAKAQPFLMPAAEEVGNKLPERLEKVLSATLDRVVK